MDEKRILSVLGPIEDESVQKKLIDETVKKFGKLDVLVSRFSVSQLFKLSDNNIEFLIGVLVVDFLLVLKKSTDNQLLRSLSPSTHHIHFRSTTQDSPTFQVPIHTPFISNPLI